MYDYRKRGNIYSFMQKIKYEYSIEAELEAIDHAMGSTMDKTVCHNARTTCPTTKIIFWALKISITFR